jgi:hypothetical protein
MMDEVCGQNWKKQLFFFVFSVFSWFPSPKFKQSQQQTVNGVT